MKTHIRTNGASVKTEDGVRVHASYNAEADGMIAVNAFTADGTYWPGVFHITEEFAAELYVVLGILLDPEE